MYYMLTSSISCGLWPCTDLMNNKKLQLQYVSRQEQAHIILTTRIHSASIDGYRECQLLNK